ncbi:MAG TPA: DMP19 family protein [Cyclobacteriaceae bacterium]|nr:DMP19 family protein [Cyclobacteriaceae bacterium]
MINQYIIIDDKAIETLDVMELLKPLWTVNIYDGKEKYEDDLKPFSIPQRSVFAIMWYINEVSNGGHLQFYSNSTGIVWEDAVKGFKLIGLEEHIRIIEESIVRFGVRPSFDRQERCNQLKFLALNFHDLDTRFYEAKRSVNLDKQILNYIKKNSTAFYFEGNVRFQDD